MTPTKSTTTGAAAAVPQITKRGSTRYSILSDPRLSQLFALSSQLEALAHSIDVMPDSSSASSSVGPATAEPSPSTVLPPALPPALPPKPTMQLQNSSKQSLNNNMPPPVPPKLNGNTTVQYRRLDEYPDNNEDDLLLDDDQVINVAPPPRYSTISDNSRMSTSSQGAESTPSAHSLLSDSLLLQSGEMMPDSPGEQQPEEESVEEPKRRDSGQGESDNEEHQLVGGGGGGQRPTTEAEWQARCIELEMALQKFRDQAHNIRKLLRDKLSELEHRVLDAEMRAEDAEGKVRLMERRLNEFDWPQPNDVSTTTTSTSTTTQQQLRQNATTNEAHPYERDRLIRTLESEVEAQRALRLADAKAVEAKAARIKDWVTNKLRELEDQNAHLKVQNAKANDQMELLRNRLEQLQVLGASTKSRQSSMAEQDSSLGSFEGEPVVSDDSLQEVGLLSTSTKSKCSKSANQALLSSKLGSVRPATTVVDQNVHARAHSGTTSSASPAKMKGQRVVSADPSLSSQLDDLTKAAACSSSQAAKRSNRGHEQTSAATVSTRDSRVDSGSVDLETPLELSPKSPLEVLDEALNSVIMHQRPVPPPRTKLPPPSSSAVNSTPTRLNKGRSESDCELAATLSSSTVTGRDDDNTTLPDRHRSLVMPLAPLPVTKKLSATAKKQQLMMSDEVHDYSEIYTPSNEEANQTAVWAITTAAEDTTTATTASTTSMSADSSRSGGGRTGSGDSGLHGLSGVSGQPPPPPMHRYPSWEDRIYQVASEGMSKDVVVIGAQIDTRNNNSSHVGHLRGGFGSDISVPVYATVKGRASQIRSMPFTGDSSDSESDGANDDVDCLVMGRGTSSRNTTTTTTTSSTSGDISLTSPRGVTHSPSPFNKPNVRHKHHYQPPSITLHPPPSSTAPFGATSSPTPKSVSTGVKLDASFDSDMSNDYAIPPDAGNKYEMYVDGSLAPLPPSTPSRSLLESPRKSGIEKALEKSGYLTKLGGKIKSWRRRYFVLKNGCLSYWKSQHDTHRKPQGLIVLDDTCRVSRADGANTFEIATENKTYYLTADSQPLMEDWVRVLQNVVQRNALRLLLSREDGVPPTLQGWLTKVKHGHARRVWCMLLGKMFVYFRTPNDANPAGQINMRDTRVEEVSHISSDSDSDETEEENNVRANKEPTIGIFTNHVHQGPTYLIFGSKQDKEQWLYHLTVVSGGDPKAGTQFEQLVQKLMEEDGNPHSAIWRNPIMTYSKEAITTPLTTFTSDTLQAEALKLFKSLLLFTTVVMDSAGIDYHVMLAANAFQQCLDMPALQQELLCALCKQTSRLTTQGSKHGVQVKKQPSIRHTRSFLMNATHLFSCDSSAATKSPPGPGPASLVSSGGINSASSVSACSDSKANPASCVFIQGWMLMAMAASIFVPKSSKLLWFLRTHFTRNKDSKTEAGKYAAYCSRALERAVTNGPRQAKPSRMEVLSILLKNPHHHSLPHAMPVHFANDTYQVVGFDGSTTIAEFLNDLNQELGCRPVEQSGFTIFSDDPIDKELDHALHLEDKVCDVISRWETALREKGMGKFENKRVIRFVYKNRLFWRKNVAGEVDKERLLFCYQISKQIVQGRFPLNKELAFELAALMAQIHYGDLNMPDKTSSSSSGVSSGGSTGSSHKHSANDALERFFPVRYIEAADGDLEPLETCILEKWATLRGKSVYDCVRIFLTCTRKWQFFGAQLFQVQNVNDRSSSNSRVWLAVNEDGISLLDHTTMQLVSRYSYDSVVTFGGCQEDFMLVVTSSSEVPERRHYSHQSERSSQDSSGTTKLLFNTGKPQILQITLLIADYMNMIGKTAPGLLAGGASGAGATPATPKSTLSRAHSSRGSSRGRILQHSTTSTAPSTPRPDRSMDCIHAHQAQPTPRLSADTKKKWPPQQQLDNTGLA